MPSQDHEDELFIGLKKDQLQSDGIVFHREYPGLYQDFSGLPPAGGGPDPHYFSDNPERLMLIQGSNPPTINVTTPSGIPIFNEDGTQMVIENSKEGWAEAMRLVLQRYTRPNPINPHELIIDFSRFRPRGDSIVGTAARYFQTAQDLKAIIGHLNMSMVKDILTPDPHDTDIPIIIDVPPTKE